MEEDNSIAESAEEVYTEAYEDKGEDFDPRENIPKASDLNLPRNENDELAAIVGYSRDTDRTYIITPMTYRETQEYDVFLNPIGDLDFQAQAEIINKHLVKPSPEDIAPGDREELTGSDVADRLRTDMVTDILSVIVQYSGHYMEDADKVEDLENNNSDSKKKGQNKTKKKN